MLATVLQNSLGGLTQVTPGTQPSPESIALFQQTYLKGLENAYLLTFGAATFAIVLALLLPGWPLKQATRPATVVAKAEGANPIALVQPALNVKSSDINRAA
jgi:hypothetical protein